MYTSALTTHFGGPMYEFDIRNKLSNLHVSNFDTYSGFYREFTRLLNGLRPDVPKDGDARWYFMQALKNTPMFSRLQTRSDNTPWRSLKELTDAAAVLAANLRWPLTARTTGGGLSTGSGRTKTHDTLSDTRRPDPHSDSRHHDRPQNKRAPSMSGDTAGLLAKQELIDTWRKEHHGKTNGIPPLGKARNDAERALYKNSGLCFACGTHGHRTADCPMKPARMQGN